HVLAPRVLPLSELGPPPPRRAVRSPPAAARGAADARHRRLGIGRIPRGPIPLPLPLDPQSPLLAAAGHRGGRGRMAGRLPLVSGAGHGGGLQPRPRGARRRGSDGEHRDRKSTRLNSRHTITLIAVVWF